MNESGEFNEPATCNHGMYQKVAQMLGPGII